MWSPDMEHRHGLLSGDRRPNPTEVVHQVHAISTNLQSIYRTLAIFAIYVFLLSFVLNSHTTYTRHYLFISFINSDGNRLGCGCPP
jgi:Fe2+ or Zn2+ uptake regulation protein